MLERMFAGLKARITRLHWGWQIPALVGYGLLRLLGLISQMLGWMLVELGSQAKVKAKKTFAPLLWPIVIVAGLLLLYAVVGPRGMEVLWLGAIAPLIGLVAGLWFMWFAARLMWRSTFSSTGKKKKKK